MTGGLPTDRVQQVTLLLSAASTVRDRDVRAAYLGSARSLLTQMVEDVRRLEAAVVAMEAEMVREAKALREDGSP